MKKKNKILLVDPPFPERPWDINWLTLFPPKGLLYIASALKSANMDVEVFDAKIMQYERPSLLRRSFKEICALFRYKIESGNYSIIGITSSTLSFKPAFELAKIAKRFSPKSIVVIGGVHASFIADEILSGDGAIDIVVRGEGERPAVEIASGKALKDIAGISYRKNGKPINNPMGPALTEEEIPIPAYDCVNMKQYSYVVLQCVRGCFHNCSYCEIPYLCGTKLRHRCAGDILKELDLALELNPNLEIRLEDEFLNKDMARARNILEGIRQKKLSPFRTAIRPDSVDDELLKLLKAAGCSNLYVGIESGSEKVLNINKRGLDLERIYQFMQSCKRNQMLFHAGFILGLPGETEKTIIETFSLADKCADITFSIVRDNFKELLRQFPFALIVENSRPEFNLLAPNPGTPIARNPGEFNYKIFHRNWEEYDCNTLVGQPAALDSKKLLGYKQQAIKRVKRKMNEFNLPVEWWDNGYKG